MRRLTGLDAGFLYMETPTLLMHTLKIAVLDPSPWGGTPPFEAIREQIGERLHLLPPFRERVVEVPLRLHHPVWIEDPDFDLAYHVRQVSVPAPGTRAQMDEVIGRLAGRPLDRTRPLWELYVLEGLEDGRIGILVKIHHAAADGVAATELLANVMTTSADEIEVPSPARAWRPEPVPSAWLLLRDAFIDHLRQLRDLPRLVVSTMGKLGRLRRHRQSTEVATPRPILDTPNVSFNASLTHRRSFASTSLPLDRAREVKAACAVTLNDVVLAIVGGGLRAYLQERSELPAVSLVAGVPVSSDRPDDVRRLGGNRVSNLFTTLATDVEDPLARVRAIHAVTAEAKQIQNLLGAELMQQWVQYTPPGPYAWFMHEYSRYHLADRHHPPINVIVSNVPGPREPLYAAGAKLVDLYSVGPVLEGIGLNITMWSYLDRLEVGVLGCRAAIPDAHVVTDRLHEALDELVDATVRRVDAPDRAVKGERG